MGSAGCLSFYPTKNLGCFGDGGMITTNAKTIAETARMLRVHGSKVRYYHELVGFNSRLDEIQASVLRDKTQVSGRVGRKPRKERGSLLFGLEGTSMRYSSSRGKGEIRWSLTSSWRALRIGMP